MKVEGCLKKSPQIRRIWFTTLVVQAGQGFMNGLFLYVWGPYFYDHFARGVDVGTAITITMFLFAFRQGMVAFLEVPTGALADTIGRGHVTLLAFAVRSIFFLSLAAITFCSHISTTIFWASLASIGYAISYTFFNGAFSAWCADTLYECDPNIPYAWLSSRYAVYQSIGEIFGAVLSIVCFIKRYPFIVFLVGAGIAYALMGFGFSRLQEPKVIKRSAAGKLQTSAVIRQIGQRIAEGFVVVRNSSVISWVILVYGAYMFMMSLMLHLWPIYLRTATGAAQLSRAWIGITVIILCLNMFGARLFVWINDRWTRKDRGTAFRFATYRRLYVSMGALCAVSVITFSAWSFIGHPPIATFIAMLGIILFSAGFLMSGFDILVNSLIGPERAKDRATIVSAGSMVRSLLTLILAIPAGGTNAQESPISWSIPAVILLVAVVGAWFTLRSDEQRRLTRNATSEANGSPVGEVSNAIS